MPPELQNSQGLEAAILAIAQAIKNGAVDGQSYSTNEVDTGAKWIDGKSIFKLTTTKANTSGTGEQFLTGIAPNATFIVKGEAMLYDATDYYPNGYSNYNAPSLQSLNGKFQLNSGAFRFAYVGLTNGTLVVTTYYTK